MSTPKPPLSKPSRATGPEAFTTPAQIRGLMAADLQMTSDTQLLCVMLGTGGSTVPEPGQRPKTRSAFALANALVEATGSFDDLLREVRSGSLQFTGYKPECSPWHRLRADMELIERWRRGFTAGGDATVRALDWATLCGELTDLRGASEAELIAFTIGARHPDPVNGKLLMDYFGSPQALFEQFSLVTFQAFRSHYRSGKDQQFLKLPRPSACFRLLAAIELAERHRRRMVSRLAPLGPSQRELLSKRLGLRSAELTRLLAPESPLDAEQRDSLLEVLRSHPDLAPDFERLDRLVADAQTPDVWQAIELHHQFETLLEDPSWSDPRALLGERVPFRGLLAIAEARLARTEDESSGELARVKERLEAAERQALAQPVAAFVGALAELCLSPAGVEAAVSEASRRCEVG
ncbi:MAG: hypothetical protein AAF560_05760 [Acidobacteriota bacterium]